MWREKSYRLQSSSPLLMQNPQTADPRNHFAKKLKEVTGKRKKTDSDQEQIDHISFLGSLCMNEDGPCIPPTWIEATLEAAARKERSGPKARAGIYCDGSFDLEYDGPRDPESLYENDNFRDSRSVVVQRARVMRVRPTFRNWSALVTVNFDDELVNESELDRWFIIAGQQCGIGTYRPRYGRFESSPVPAAA